MGVEFTVYSLQFILLLVIKMPMFMDFQFDGEKKLIEEAS